MSTPPKVFVSFAFANKAEATKVVEALKAANLETWYCIDELQSGDVFDRQIHGNINDCNCGLLLLSAASAKSDECLSEWRYVLSRGKKLYLARLADLTDADFLYRLRIYQYADLGKDFDAGLAALVKAIRARTDLDANDPTTGVALRTAGSFPSWQLIRPLVGRDSELTDVSTWLATPRTVVLTGTGGVGKTKLAAEAAVRSALPDGVMWYLMPRADTQEKAEDDLGKLTNLLRQHLSLPPTDDDDAVWLKLGAASLLLVLDNAEDCQHPQPYITRLDNLSHAGGTQVLVTSRVAWPGLRSAHVLTLPMPPPDEAYQILREIVHDKLPPTHWPTDAALAELAKAAHYHPRLMELASGWLNEQPAADVVAMLRELPSLRGDPDLDAALQELIGRTLTLMRRQPGGDVAYQLLARLVVCRGGFSAEAAKALLPEGVVLRTPLGLLVRWNLLRFDGTRYDTDPLTRDAVVPDPDAYPLHYDYYYALARQHDERKEYAGLNPESANLEAAFEWALRASEVERAYWLSNTVSDLFYNRGRFAQTLRWFQRVEAALPGDATPDLRAALNISLGISYAAQPLGNRSENLQRAVAAYEAALRHSTEAAAPFAFAMTQNNLGNAYRDLSQVEDRPGNLRRAIAAYEAALRHHIEAAAPLAFAATQNNLGNAYRDLSQVEDRPGNLRRAVAAYEAALRHRTEAAAPLAFAMTQNNLGNAYSDLAQVEDRPGNLRRAVVAYGAALCHYTEAAAPLAFATTQNNLGNAYRNLSQAEDRPGNLRRAVAACEAALRHYTEATAPLDFAMTQNNLGIAYGDFSQVEDRPGNLRRAVAAYEAALRHYTEAAAPLAFAMTQNNLGNAYRNLAQVEDRPGNLRRAVAAYEAALRHRTESAAPLDFAMTQNNLGTAYRNLLSVAGESTQANFEATITAYQAARRVAAEHDDAVRYATATSDLGILSKMLGNLPDAIKLWEEAEGHFRRIGYVADADRQRAWIEEAQARLNAPPTP